MVTMDSKVSKMMGNPMNRTAKRFYGEIRR